MITEMRLARVLRVVLLTVLCSPLPLPAAGKPSLDAEVAEYIIRKFITLHQSEETGNWTYREERLIQKLAENGLIRKTTSAAYQWLARGEERENRLLERDGKPAADAFVKVPPPSGLVNLSLDRVSERYNFKIIKFENIHGRDVARVHFSPRKQQPRPRGRLEKVLSRLEGDLWVILEERQLVKAYALLTEPVKFGAGILGQVKKLEISYAQQQVGNYWVAESFEFEIDMRRFLGTVRTRERRRYSEFQKGILGAGTMKRGLAGDWITVN